MPALTIDLPPELGARLQEVAERRGLPLPDCARELLAESLGVSAAGLPSQAPRGASTTHPLPPADDAAQVEGAAARRPSFAGKYAHVGGSVADFIADKAERIRHEEECDRMLWQQGGQ